MTLSARPPLPLSGLPQPCCKMSLPEHGGHRKGLSVPGSGGDQPAATPAVVWLPRLQVAPQKELAGIIDFMPKQHYSIR